MDGMRGVTGATRELELLSTEMEKTLSRARTIRSSVLDIKNVSILSDFSNLLAWGFFLPSDKVYIRFLFVFFFRLVYTYIKIYIFYLFMPPPSVFTQMVTYHKHCSASCFCPLTVCLRAHTISYPAQNLFILFNDCIGHCVLYLNLFNWF